jgi:hypothetical protein
MKRIFALLAALIMNAAVQAQGCHVVNGYNQAAVVNGYNQAAVINNYGFNQAAVTFRTGTADVACAGGLCVAPVDNGHAVYNNGHHGHHNNAVVVPQSTAFFAFSNPNVIAFRTRQFVQVPHSSEVVALDSYGNQVLLNAGVYNDGYSTIQSRGQRLFVR